MKFDKNFGWNNNSNSNSNISVKTIQDNEFIKLLIDNNLIKVYCIKNDTDIYNIHIEYNNDLIITIDDSFDCVNIIKVGESILYSREGNINLINYSMDNKYVVRIPFSMINGNIQIDVLYER